MFISDTLLKVAAGVVAALVIGLGITGWMLKHAWQDNATLEANNKKLTATIESQEKAYKELEAAKETDETIVTDNAEQKQTIIKYRDRVKYEIKKIIEKVPADDCLNQLMPADLLECLHSDSCNEAGDKTDVPSQGVDAGHAGAGAAG